MKIFHCLFLLSILSEIKGKSTIKAPMRRPEDRCIGTSDLYLVINPSRIWQLPLNIQIQCAFYLCVNTYYKLQSCPAGKSIGKNALRRARKGFAQNTNPCVRNGFENCKSIVGNALVFEDDQRVELAGDNDVIYALPPPPKQRIFCGVDLFWVIDMSCSIKDINKQAIVEFVMEVINGFQISAVHMKTGGVTYGATVYSIQTLREGRNRALTLKNFQNMVTIPAKCQTATDEALLRIKRDFLSESNGNRPEFPDAMIVITDGNTFHGRKQDNAAFSRKTVEIATEIREMGVTTYVIGLPSGSKDKITEDSYREWLGIAGEERNIFLMANFAQLKQQVTEMSSKACVST
ncbi:unnamed protein product [Owenia fusiformis]|uniref:Uncharacterized protein n=1 Tax=Owenia fusiformis TaxID=6347 RepID=A0A8J1TYA5_OWEFU|nr:unnamed protein product [Owenia fusiformis]